MKSIKAALTPLAEYTNVFSADRYATISSVLPLLAIFDNCVEEAKNEPTATNLTKTILEHAHNYLVGKYSEANIKKLLSACSLVDPRYKADYLSADNETNNHRHLWNV